MSPRSCENSLGTCHIFKGRFQFPGKPDRISKNRRGHFVSQDTADLLQPLRISRQLGGDPDIVIQIPAGPFRMPDGIDQCCPCPRSPFIPVETDDRHALPQRLDGRRTPVPRKGIERDIDLVVRLQKLNVGRRTQQIDARWINAVAGKLSPQKTRKMLVEMAIAQDKTTIGDRRQNAGPCLNTAGMNLVRGRQTSERTVAVSVVKIFGPVDRLI